MIACDDEPQTVCMTVLDFGRGQRGQLIIIIIIIIIILF